jgi:signal transduction histidine kinase
MLNILSNACKFTKQGSIWLRAKQIENDVLISVQDTGPGIPLEEQSLVFEAFKQTDTGLRQSGGTGLGMPISKTLVEAHGGRLWIESKAGEGATFFVSLPIKSQQLVPLISTMRPVNS